MNWKLWTFTAIWAGLAWLSRADEIVDLAHSPDMTAWAWIVLAAFAAGHLALCYGTGCAARNRGRSFGVFYVCSVIFSWLMVYPVLVCMGRKNAEADGHVEPKHVPGQLVGGVR
jgi:hypothetical protein